MKKTSWIDESELNQIDWIKKCNSACDKWKRKNMDEISLFYSYFTVSQHEKFTKEICEKINLDLNGVGLEIGSGPGILSNSLIKIYNNIKKIYLLEKAPNTFSLMKKVAFENNTSNKLECVIGCFNDLKFPANSLDFVLDFDSIHHSDDFDKTIMEISRVLKPGGILLCFDRAQPNYISNQQIKDMIDVEYSKEYKIENNIDINQKYTRRMDGEHEPKLSDWTNAAKENNLALKVFIFHKKSFRDFIRSLYGLITPYFLKKIINKGINITTHYQILFHYLLINNIAGIRVFNLDYILKSKRSPRGKMIFLFKKL